jgi:hypothetical protein
MRGAREEGTEEKDRVAKMNLIQAGATVSLTGILFGLIIMITSSCYFVEQISSTCKSDREMKLNVKYSHNYAAWDSSFREQISVLLSPSNLSLELSISSGHLDVLRSCSP